ncbi:hypothetical protein LJB98_00070 [Bacteroidales bacterium OttesenSCG-928-M11]|nr:hypothetical protein [Bacteroidales bacterium OttesenSCG-928-M11]
MKKVFLFLLMAVVFSACTTEKYYEDYFITETVEIYSEVFTVKNSMWETGYDDSGSYLYCTFPEAQLTRKVINDGMLIGYFYYSLNGVSILSALPFSDFYVDGDYKWEEHLTVEFEPGYITFILKMDDHNTNFDPMYTEYQFVVKFTK